MINNIMRFLKENYGQAGLLAGIMLVLTGGIFAIVGVYTTVLTYDAVRWDTTSGEALGTANTTGYLSATAANTPINTGRLSGSAAVVSCNGTAVNSSVATVTVATGAIVVNDTIFSGASCGNASVTMTYEAEVEATMTTLYNKIMKALIIMGTAMIIVGAKVIIDTLQS